MVTHKTRHGRLFDLLRKQRLTPPREERPLAQDVDPAFGRAFLAAARLSLRADPGPPPPGRAP